jgi:hypothetical protein
MSPSGWSTTAAVLALSALSGCAPQTVRWSEEASTVEPEHAAARGYLSVEQVDPLVVRSRVPRMRSAPFRLYDDRGRYLAKYNDPYLPPISIAPGRYVVVARVEREDRQIQVLIRQAQFTRVDLSRLEERRRPEIPAVEPAESVPETR